MHPKINMNFQISKKNILGKTPFKKKSRNMTVNRGGGFSMINIFNSRNISCG